MTKNFIVTINGTQLDFHTMNIKRLQLFQVYGVEAGTKYRFHMQVDEQGIFEITKKEFCPEKFVLLEKELHAAILANGVA